MARSPVTIILQASPSRSGWYRVRIVGWGVPDVGPYGSLWSIDLPVQVSTAASSAQVLNQIGQALLDRTSHVGGVE